MRVLDLFCGAGGAARGIKYACPKAEIIGIDIEPQPNYPFEFMQVDWLTGAEAYRTWADFFWASPVCKRYTQMLNHGRTNRNRHPDFIPEVRNWLTGNAKPWVIENVAGAPLRNAGMLCGEMFNLRVQRHRFFETSFPVIFPMHIKHRGTGHRKQGDGGYYFRVYGHETGKRQWGAAMGIDWMRSPELAQAIPPAYSQYIMESYIGAEDRGGPPMTDSTHGKGEGCEPWVSCKQGLPLDGQEVATKIDDEKGCRNEFNLKRQGNLWFFPDMSMYVYYTPTHWRPL